ncbi:ABC transporter ATP-binding protein [Brevibacillus fluminis]|uniref:ABC transporter ATP-binding protein n=1 Tax=Brevibacillus fluminis TaxID=511487 RepID=A0A3M8DVX8_9BACL|nr:ABC transporter ATP-binding protein [Brevibacillus fluminis]RNB91645.1 ABC transporter ATP-binding protein [Brevibacillus fluminis]
MALLEVKQHSLFFHGDERTFNILDRVSFHVEKGEILGIVGESGCGKSMLAGSIMGLYPANVARKEGSILYEGKDLLAMSAKQRERYRGEHVSMIFQNPNTSLNPVITIGKQMIDIISEHKRMSKKDAKNLAIKWLGEVGLAQAEDIFASYPHQLSGGMKQRVVIAMALSCDAELIVADEPTTALDVTTQFQILRLIKRLQKEYRVSIVIVTHNIGVAGYLCDRIMVMYAGQVIEVGPTEQILRNPVHSYTKGLLKCLPGQGKNIDELYTIPGTVPSPLDFPSGCRYSSRCQLAQPHCKEHAPQLEQLVVGIYTACFYPEKECEA